MGEDPDDLRLVYDEDGYSAEDDKNNAGKGLVLMFTWHTPTHDYHDLPP